MKPIIKLDSHSGHNFLRVVKGNKYKLITGSGMVRTGQNPDGTLRAIDPSGGPVIRVGDTIEGGTVKCIYYSKRDHGFIVEFV